MPRVAKAQKGSHGDAFAKKFAEFHTAKYAQCVNTGTVAIQAALKAIGIEPMGIMVQDDAPEGVRRRVAVKVRAHISDTQAAVGTSVIDVRLPPRELPCVALIPS